MDRRPEKLTVPLGPRAHEKQPMMPSAGRMKKFIFRRFFGTSERSFHYEMDKKSVLSQCAFWRKFEKGHQHDDPKRILIIFAVVFFGENPEFDHGLKGSSFIGQHLET